MLKNLMIFGFAIFMTANTYACTGNNKEDNKDSQASTSQSTPSNVYVGYK